MSDFSTTEAAFEGLRLSRERPLAVLWWWGAYVAATLIQFVMTVQPAFRGLNDQLIQLQVQSMALQQSPNDAIAMQNFRQVLGHVAGPMALFAVVILLMQMVLSTAVLRAVLRPADKAVGYLRLGMDEVRQLGLALVILAAVVCYAFIISIVSSVIIGVIVGLSGGAIAPQALGAVAVAAIWVAFLYPAVRLSLAPAMTLADGRISFLRAWALTKDRFWQLLAAYLLAGVVFAVIFFCGAQILALLVHLVTPGDKPLKTESLSDLASPGVIIVVIGNGLLAAAAGAVATAPMASAFRQLTGRVGAPVAPTTPTRSGGSPWEQP